MSEHLGLEFHQFCRERNDKRCLETCVGEQLESPFERADQLDLIPESDSRVRIEGDRGRHEARPVNRSDNAQVPAMHAVEGADGCGAGHALELGRCVGNPHRLAPSASERDALS